MDLLQWWVPSEWESRLLIKTWFHIPDNHCFQRKYESSIYNIAFSSENIISAESGEKYAQIKQKQSKAVLIKCQWILMWEDNRQLFHWRRRYYGLWTSIFISSDGLNLKHVTYGFILLQTCSFSIDNTCVWIIVIFLSAVWFSFWRHPFIAEDPLVNK